MALELVDDLRYSILELNAHAMQRSQTGQLVEAQQLLETAYIRLQSADAAVLAADAGLIDQLKATTLSNLGVVECHKKELDKSLDHLEAALAIEKRIGIFSPTTALNLCATFNALGRYEEGVEICTGAIQTLMGTNGGRPTEENKTLWAAAWHNLSVAEMNLGGDIGGPEDRKVAVLNMFKNAMRASVDLLGAKHPLTATIHESYRAARPTLKKQGAYKLRDPLLPTLTTSSSNSSLDKKRNKHNQNLTDDERLGTVPAYEGALAGNTGRTNISRDNTRRVPSLLTAVRNAQRGEHGFRPTHTLVRAQPLYLEHHPATNAAPNQSNALLQPRQREMRRQRIPSIAPGGQSYGGKAQTARSHTTHNNNNRRSANNNNTTSSRSPNRNRRSSPKTSRGSPMMNSSRSGGQFNSNTSKVLSSLTNDRNSPGNNNNQGGVSWSSSNFNNRSAGGQQSGNNNNNRSVESALIGDMWVEVDIPVARRNSPPSHHHQGGFFGNNNNNAPALRQSGGSPGSNYNPSLGSWTNNNNNNNQQQQSSSGGHQQNYEFKAPSYGQAMHVIDPSDPIMERVSQPNTYATLDNNTGMMMSSAAAPPHPHHQQRQQQQQQQQQAPSSISATKPQLPPLAAPQGTAAEQQQMMNLSQQPNVFANDQQANQNQQQQQQQQRISTPTQGNISSSQAQAQQQHPHGATTPPIPQPPKRPASSGNVRANPQGQQQRVSSRPGSGQQQQQQQRTPQGQQQQGFNYLADALGSDIKEYPGLAMLSSM